MEWIYFITMCYNGKKKFHIFNTGFELGLFIQCLGRHGFPSTRFYALIFSQLIPNVSVRQKIPVTSPWPVTIHSVDFLFGVESVDLSSFFYLEK